MISSFVLLSIIQITFTTWFVIRTSRKYSSTFLLPNQLMTKIGTTFLTLSFGISLTQQSNSLLFFTPTIFVLLIVLGAPFLISKYFETLCHKGFHVFVDGVVLDMKCGRSLASASNLQLDSLPLVLRAWMQDRLSRKSSSESTKVPFGSEKLAVYVSEFLKIAAQNSQQLALLHHLQKQIRLDAVLRHKSRQALLQTKIQSFFLIFIYVCVLFYGLKTYPWIEFKPFFLISFSLLALGLLLLNVLTRKRKWKT